MAETQKPNMPPAELPAKAGDVAQRWPEVWAAYADLGKACAEAGPLDPATIRLIKLAYALGAASEGATHSHARRGLEEGLPVDALRQVAMLAIPRLGFPRAVAGLTWIEDVISRKAE